ncbi:MAG: mandelate racemase/muconate lactonizing enzyme family protein [Streptosporangiaceae bacterium]
MIGPARVAAVEARTVRVPLDRPTMFATRRVDARYYVLVRVRTDDGVEGIGFCYAGNGGGGIPALAVRSLLAPVVVGQDPHRTAGLWAEMYREALLHGRAGSVMRALSAIDIALWDRNARAAGLPLWRYLGSVAAETVPAYASGGYYLDGKTPEMLAEETRGYVEAGFTAVKIKIGRLDPAADAERLAAVREAVGPGVLVMLDANNAWSDLPDALRAMRAFEPHDPYWIEEPFSPDDIDNHARLAERTPVLVATGEIEAGRWRHLELLRRHAAAILQTDAAVAGGVTEFRRIADTAASFGVPMCPHWFHDLHVHLAAAAENARFVEYFPGDQVLNFRNLIDRQLDIRDGRLVLPTGPGLGFGLDGDKVETYATEPWS